MKTAYDSPVVCLTCQNMKCTHTPIHDIFHSDIIDHNTLPRSPLHILVRTHHELDQLRQTSMFSDRSMVHPITAVISGQRDGG